MNWWADAAAWAAEQLARAGRRVIGPIEPVHERIWSTVLKIPTDGGDVFLKACGPAGAHEPALLKLLSTSWPQSILPAFGVDRQRAWVLVPDGGQRLRELLARDRDFGHWRTILPIYAQMQIDQAGRVDELLSLGVPDNRLATLPAQFASLVDDVEFLYLDQPGGLRRSDHARLLAMRLRVRELCDRLDACGVPETLHHGDLHDGNVFVRGDAHFIFDWGDSCITHPFFTLRTVAASVERTLGVSTTSDEWETLRDGYLRPWARFASPGALEEAARLAQCLAPLEGVLRWRAVLSCAAPSLRDPYREHIPRLVEDLLAGISNLRPPGP